MNRRDLLKWIPPVVMVVTLPAHARTSFIIDEIDEGVAPIEGACEEGKTLICHSPKININREFDELCVADESVDSHVTLHGDTIGECNATP